MFSPCPPSAGLQTLWSLIFSLSALSSLSPHPPPPLYLFSLSLYLFCLSSSGTLYTPVSLLTSLSLLSPYLSSHRSLQSQQCTLSVTVLPLPLSLSLSSLDMDKFFPVLSLTKRPSVSDTGCLGNHHAPVTLSHLSMSRTNIHRQTHKHPLAAHTYTNSRGRFKQHCVCAFLYARMCVFIFFTSVPRCTLTCYVFVCASREFAFPACIGATRWSDQLGLGGGGWSSVRCFPQELF